MDSVYHSVCIWCYIYIYEFLHDLHNYTKKVVRVISVDIMFIVEYITIAVIIVITVVLSFVRYTYM